MILRFWVTLVNDFYKLISYLKFDGTSLLGSVTNYNLIEEKLMKKSKYWHVLLSTDFKCWVSDIRLNIAFDIVIHNSISLSS